MRGRLRFIAVVVILFVLVMAIEYRAPKHYQWVPTFSHQDPQPFGSLVFDSVMQASMPQGYHVSRARVAQLKKRPASDPFSLLIVTTESLPDFDAKSLLQMASDGHTIMIATGALRWFCDTLHFSQDYNQSFNVTAFTGQLPMKGTLAWVDEAPPYAGAPVARSVYDQLITHVMQPDSAVAVMPLLTYDEPAEKPYRADSTGYVALSFSVGRGELILVSAPLLFTNYCMINADTRVLTTRLMDRLKRHEVIRSEAYMAVTAARQSSPFYVFLQRPPLRWALYLSVLAVLLFCIFTARRRQRPIPVVAPPVNRNLEFVKLIGTLYHQQHDNADLLSRKLTYTADEIRRQAGIDILNTTDHDTLTHLSRHTGIDITHLQYVLSNIRQAISGPYQLTDAELKAYVAELNKIQQSL